MSLKALTSQLAWYAWASLCGSSALACGPFFPNQLLANGDAGVLSMPTGVFAQEIRRLQLPVAGTFKAGGGDPYAQSAIVDVQELNSALTALQTPEDQKTTIVAQYAQARKEIKDFLTPVSEYPNTTRPTPKTLPDVAVPANLPAEFDDYLRGLIAFERGDLNAARHHWLALLVLPADQRRLRTTWAMFMLGKSYLKEDPSKAVTWFVKTRQAAAGGFADGLALASSSLGWQARAELNAGHVVQAIGLYAQQSSSGDGSAVWSLQQCAEAAFKGGPTTLAEISRDRLSLQVITAYVLCDGGPWNNFPPNQKQLMPALLDAVEASAAKDAPDADRLAWAAYNTGDFNAAGRWANRALPTSAIAQWVQAKLLLRQGKVDAATAILTRVVQAFPADTPWVTYDPSSEDAPEAQILKPTVDTADAIVSPLAGDLAVLRLARGQYSDSLLLLLKGDYWMDAAYVAERVLTIDELKTFVDRNCPLLGAQSPGLHDADSIRYLLARRLTRLGRWREARPYYPAEQQTHLDAYIDGIRDGSDTDRSDADRAVALLVAARTARKFGMELLGTELAPDFFCHGGEFEYDANTRLDGRPSFVAPTKDETTRAKENQPSDQRRFHYRYIAANYAWAAAQLMPDESDATAEVLCEAGNWLAARDPKAADRFYRAVTQRCGSTPLGQQAVKLHWFPPPKR